jgi:hypothetical protein
MLAYGAFAITDLMSGAEVSNIRRNRCKFVPPSKVIVLLHEDLFHTLLPNTPLTLSTPFSRKRSHNGDKSLPKGHPDYDLGRVNVGSSRREHVPCGVDGLEPGHSYALTLADNPRAEFSRYIRWWEFGRKETVVYGEDGSPKLDGRKVHWGRGLHPAIRLDFSDFKGLVFHCID